jgi:IS5 family transposase
MTKRPERGLFDEQQAQQRVQAMNGTLSKLKNAIHWEAFRPGIEGIFPLNDPKKGGQPPFDRVMMFKILVIKKLYGLSNDQAEFQILDRFSFRDFLCLELQHRVPDATTIWLFEEHLQQGQAMEVLFENFTQRLRDAKLIVNEGKIIDASIVHAPVQHISRKENDQLDNGRKPRGWNKHKVRQKDTEATWTKKHGKSYFGFKNHTKVDTASKLIERYAVTTASVPDGNMAGELLTESDKDQRLDGDKGYDWADIHTLVAKLEIQDQIMEKAQRGRPLKRAQERANKARSRIRARIEHVYGQMTKRFEGLRLRCIGLQRAVHQTGLSNLCYNMLRVIFLLPTPSMGSV